MYAMEEFRSLCRSEPWAKAAEAPAAEEGLWTFRTLLYSSRIWFETVKQGPQFGSV